MFHQCNNRAYSHLDYTGGCMLYHIGSVTGLLRGWSGDGSVRCNHIQLVYCAEIYRGRHSAGPVVDNIGASIPGGTSRDQFDSRAGGGRIQVKLNRGQLSGIGSVEIVDNTADRIAADHSYASASFRGWDSVGRSERISSSRDNKHDQGDEQNSEFP